MTKTTVYFIIFRENLLMDFNEKLLDTVLESEVVPRPLPSPEPPVGGGLGPAPSGDRQHVTGVKADKNRLSPI